jgi:hypothetical protein
MPLFPVSLVFEDMGRLENLPYIWSRKSGSFYSLRPPRLPALTDVEGDRFPTLIQLEAD